MNILQPVADVVVANVLAVASGAPATATFDLNEDNAKKAGMMYVIGVDWGLMTMNACCTCAFACFANMKRDFVMLQVPADRK